MYQTDTADERQSLSVRSSCAVLLSFKPPPTLLVCSLAHGKSALFRSIKAIFPNVIRRFLIGFGLTFAASAAPVLVTELAYPAQRGPVTSLYNTLWYVSYVELNSHISRN